MLSGECLLAGQTADFSRVYGCDEGVMNELPRLAYRVEAPAFVKMRFGKAAFVVPGTASPCIQVGDNQVTIGESEVQLAPSG